MQSGSAHFKPSRFTAACATLAIIGAGLYLWFGWCLFPVHDWNEFRIAPAFALRHGFPLYPPLGGGPLSTWIYGPLGVVVNLPATFASSAVGAIQIAAVINLALLVLPLAWLFYCSPALRRSGRSARASALALAVLSFPQSMLLLYVADHVAILCGLFSCWCLTRNRAPTGHPIGLTAAAVWCVLSITAKQISVFLPVAQLLYLAWLERDRGAALQYLWRLVIAGAIAAGLVIGCFGFSDLWLNLVQIPGALPWAGPMSKISLRYPYLLACIVAPLVILLFTRGFKFMQETGTAESRFLRCMTVVFVVFLPIGLMSFFKIGGDLNLLYSWPYLCPALILVGIPFLLRLRQGSIWLGAVIAAMIAMRQPELAHLPTRPAVNRIRLAEQIAQRHPEGVWFPNNPLVTWYTDRKLYHVEDGIMTRHLAGIGLRETDFKRHLPSRLEAVVYRASDLNPFALPLLDFKTRHIIGDWAVYTRAGGPAPSPPPARP